MKTCDKPDRDVPTLVCGYPMPCPHHTAVIELDDPDELVRSLANLRWLRGRVSINTYFRVALNNSSPAISALEVKTIATWCKVIDSASAVDTKEIVQTLALSATIAEVRNAIEETQIEARAWLELHYATPVAPVTASECRAIADRGDEAQERFKRRIDELSGMFRARYPDDVRPATPATKRRRRP